jgi:hypothetical protein
MGIIYEYWVGGDAVEWRGAIFHMSTSASVIHLIQRRLFLSFGSA